jgi:hypothetical protein
MMPVRRSLRLILLGGLIASQSAVPALAGSPSTPPGERIDCRPTADEPFGGSGRALRLSCDLVASGSHDDSLTILSRSSAPGTTRWPSADTSDAIWIFDRGDDGATDLVVDFRPQGTGLAADLYDAQGDPARLQFTTTGGVFQFESPPPATVRVVAPGGWWHRGALVNFDLRIEVDGRVDAAFDMVRKLASTLATDGDVDFEILVGDADGDGRPDHEWRTAHLPPRDQRALEQAFVTVNPCDNEARLESMLPWPLLGSVTYGFLTVSPQPVNRPPIQVDWDSGTITTVGEFVRSRGNDCQWFVYSFRPAEAGQVNELDFENPFAWYDLAADRDRVPELSVRFMYYPAYDQQIVASTFPKPIDVIRYSWDQDNDSHWDFKLALIGFHPVTSVVELPPLSLRMVPYAQIPEWVTGRSWLSATFVASETGDTTGEGIYAWDYPAWYYGQYVTGRRDTAAPPETLRDSEIDLREYGWGSIPAGFRGEFQDRLDAKSTLYGSPIDRKLHLLNASGGIWTVDEGAEVRYANLAGGETIDQWRFRQRLEDGGVASSELDVSASHLVYRGIDGIAIREAVVPPIAFTTLPPATNDEWQRLSGQLEALGPPLGPGDFRDIMLTFPGPELAIAEASLRDYRPTDTGFRFVLQLLPGFEVQGEDLLAVAGRDPGSYAVSWDGAFAVEPLRPATIRASLNVEPATALAQTLVTVELRNDGLDDLRGGRLELSATSPDGISGIVATQPVDILAGEPLDVALLWGPDSPGIWHLASQVTQADGTVTVGGSLSLVVQAAAPVSGTELLSLSARDSRIPMLLAVLLIIAALAALSVGLGWRARLRR